MHVSNCYVCILLRELVSGDVDTMSMAAMIRSIP